MAMIMKRVSRYPRLTRKIQTTQTSTEGDCLSSMIKLGEVIEFRKPV